MRSRATFSDWASWPEPVNGRLELIDGAATVHPRSDDHTQMACLVAGLLYFGGEQPASAVGVVVGGHSVLVPDICLLGEEIDSPASDQDYAEGDGPWVATADARRRRVRVAIDLDSDTRRLDLLEAAGVPGDWHIDPRGDLLAYKGEGPPEWFVESLAATPPPGCRFAGGTATCDA